MAARLATVSLSAPTPEARSGNQRDAAVSSVSSRPMTGLPARAHCLRVQSRSNWTLRQNCRGCSNYVAGHRWSRPARFHVFTRTGARVSSGSQRRNPRNEDWRRQRVRRRWHGARGFSRHRERIESACVTRSRAHSGEPAAHGVCAPDLLHHGTGRGKRKPGAIRWRQSTGS